MRFLMFASLIIGLCRCGAGPSASDDWYEGLLDVEGWAIVDRAGVPLLTQLLIENDEAKDAFNRIEGDDEARAEEIADYRPLVAAKAESLRSKVVSFLAAEDLGSTAVSSDAFATLVVPDVLRLDLGDAVAFPNGRGLDDDVFDLFLGLMLNRGSVFAGGKGVQDKVKADDTVADEFPYLDNPQ